MADQVSSWVSINRVNEFTQIQLRFVIPTGGGMYLLLAQTFSVTCLFLWGVIATYPILWFVNKITPLRLSPEDEIKGCDLVEHYMGDENEKLIHLLEGIKISNAHYGGPQINFTIDPMPYKRGDQASGQYKEFDTLGTRKPFNINHEENVSQQHTTERL